MTVATAFFSNTTAQFVLLGLAAGSLSAIVALGIVVTYRASGVLNFAATSLGGIAAYFFYWLRGSQHVATGPALVLALLGGALLGALTQVVVMDLLRRVSLLGKLIATLGLAAAAQGVIAVIWGPLDQLPNSIFPTRAVTIASGVVVPEERLIILGIAIVLAIALRTFYSLTTFGLATSAVAENRRVAASSGWSPRVIELFNFTLGGILAAAAAIFLAPIAGLSISVLALAVLPALAAALVGRFSSFSITVAAALAIGVISAEIALFQPSIAGWFGTSAENLGDLSDVVPLLIIVAMTALSGRSRLQRGESLTRLPLPGDGAIRPLLLLLGIGAGAALIFGGASVNWVDAMIVTLSFAILSLSLVVVTGYAGQLSLCQFALAGFGAWVAARLVATQGWSFEAGLVAAMTAAIPLGLLVALPALRTRGVNLAVATLALAEMIYAVVFNSASLTGGYIGTVVPPAHFFGLNVDPILHTDRYAAMVLIAFVLAGVCVANIRRGRTGRRLLAVRANERAAAALGVGVYTAKLYAFAVSSAIAALAGVMIGFSQGPNIQFTNFDVFTSINAVLYAVVGGIGWASGSIVGAMNAPGALPTQAINDVFGGISNLTSWLLIFAGASVIAVLRFAADGLAAVQSAQFRQVFGRFRRQARPLPPPKETGLERREPAQLTVEGIGVRFGGVVALDDVSFSVSPGEIVGLIGPNGAGKTTLLDVVTGFTRAAGGRVLLGGKPIDRLSPEARARAGIGRSWQAVELFEEMTVRENLLVASDTQHFVRYLTDVIRPGRAAPTAAMSEIVAEFQLSPYLEHRPSKLSHGTARLVGIGRAISMEPTILLLDEPAAGLDSRESTELGVAIRAAVARSGVGVLIVEHDVNLLLSICDRIVVLDFGRKIAEGTPTEVAKDPAVIQAYLGVAASDADQQADEPAVAIREP